MKLVREGRLEQISTILKYIYQLFHLKGHRWKTRLFVCLLLFLPSLALLPVLLPPFIKHAAVQARKVMLCEEIRILSNDVVIYKCSTIENFTTIFSVCDIQISTRKESSDESKGTTVKVKAEPSGKCPRVMSELQEKSWTLSSLVENMKKLEQSFSMRLLTSILIFCVWIFTGCLCWTIFNRPFPLLERCFNRCEKALARCFSVGESAAVAT